MFGNVTALEGLHVVGKNRSRSMHHLAFEMVPQSPTTPRSSKVRPHAQAKALTESQQSRKVNSAQWSVCVQSRAQLRGRAKRPFSLCIFLFGCFAFEMVLAKPDYAEILKGTSTWVCYSVGNSDIVGNSDVW